MTPRVRTLRDPAAVRALAQPARLAVLEALREADSAAGVARTIGQSRQSVNYHLQELARARLVEHAGERRKGNFVEQLYRAVARRFVISPRFAWDPQRLEGALRDQAALAGLIDLGSRLCADATALLDRAISEGEQIASATVEAEIGFASAEERAQFMNEYLAALGPLLQRYGSRAGARYRVALAVYPGSDTAPHTGPTEDSP